MMLPSETRLPFATVAIESSFKSYFIQEINYLFVGSLIPSHSFTLSLQDSIKTDPTTVGKKYLCPWSFYNSIYTVTTLLNERTTTKTYSSYQLSLSTSCKALFCYSSFDL